MEEFEHLVKVEISEIDNLSELRKDVEIYLSDNYQFYGQKGIERGVAPFMIKSMSSEDNPFLVIVTKNTIDKLISEGGKVRLSALYYLKEIVENGSLIDKPQIPRKPEFEKFIYFFRTKVEVDNLKYWFLFSVKEMKNLKDKKKVYSGHLDIKKTLNE